MCYVLISRIEELPAPYIVCNSGDDDDDVKILPENVHRRRSLANFNLIGRLVDTSFYVFHKRA